MVTLLRTNNADPGFHSLIALLEEDLSQRYGQAQAAYSPFNSLEKICAVVIAMNEGEPVACGSFKPFEEDAVEMKRVFVKSAYRGQGLSKRILQDLESWALELGFVRAVLETGPKQPEAIALYTHSGYSQIDNFEPYVGFDDSVCFAKDLKISC